MYTKYDQSSEDWGRHWHTALCRKKIIAHSVGVSIRTKLNAGKKNNIKCRGELWGWDVMLGSESCGAQQRGCRTQTTEDLQRDLVPQTTGLKRLVPWERTWSWDWNVLHPPAADEQRWLTALFLPLFRLVWLKTTLRGVTCLVLSAGGAGRPFEAENVCRRVNLLVSYVKSMIRMQVISGHFYVLHNSSWVKPEVATTS